MPFSGVPDWFPAPTGDKNLFPVPGRTVRSTECGLIELDLAFPPEIVRDLIPGGGSRVERFLSCHLTRKRPSELGLRGDVVLEYSGNPRLDRPVGVIIRIGLRGEIRRDEFGRQPRSGPQLLGKTAIPIWLETRRIEGHPGAQVLAAEVSSDAPGGL